MPASRHVQGRHPSSGCPQRTVSGRGGRTQPRPVPVLCRQHVKGCQPRRPPQARAISGGRTASLLAASAQIFQLHVLNRGPLPVLCMRIPTGSRQNSPHAAGQAAECIHLLLLPGRRPGHLAGADACATAASCSQQPQSLLCSLRSRPPWKGLLFRCVHSCALLWGSHGDASSTCYAGRHHHVGPRAPAHDVTSVGLPGLWPSPDMVAVWAPALARRCLRSGIGGSAIPCSHTVSQLPNRPGILSSSERSNRCLTGMTPRDSIGPLAATEDAWPAGHRSEKCDRHPV